MIINWLGDENFRIKSKNLIVKIGEKNYLGELEISGPGEYEVSGIQMEIFDNIIQVYVEGLTIGHIKKGKILSDLELQKLNGINILLLGVGGKKFSETKIATELINQIEPNLVIPMYVDDLNDFEKAKEASKDAKDELKISKTDLPEEDYNVIVLKAITKNNKIQ